MLVESNSQLKPWTAQTVRFYTADLVCRLREPRRLMRPLSRALDMRKYELSSGLGGASRILNEHKIQESGGIQSGFG
jgi:hypothetical protein